MKKALGMVLIGGALLAGQFETKVEAKLNEVIPETRIDVIKVVPISDFKLVVSETKDKIRFPLISDSKGEFLFPFQLPITSVENVNLLTRELNSITEYNEKAQKRIVFTEIYDKLDKKGIVTLKSTNKVATETERVIIDPECPYCKQYLDKIDEVLEFKNVEIILANIFGESSAIKSSNIIAQTKKNMSNKDKLLIIKKYTMKDYNITPKDKKVDTTVLEKNNKIIFIDNSFVKGVPFVF